MTETSFIINSLSFLVFGLVGTLLMLGFTLLEVSAVKKTEVPSIIGKNLSLFALTSLLFYLVGYNLIYGGFDPEFLGGYIGTFQLWNTLDQTVIYQQNYEAGYASSADWFFQILFVLAAVFIFSTIIRNRVPNLTTLLFAIILGGLLYPIITSWYWGGGWLGSTGFADFSGASLVHSLAGWCALTGTLIIGNQKGYMAKKTSLDTNLYSIGVILLSISLVALHAGSQLAFGTALDAISTADVMTNSYLAITGSILAALVLKRVLKHKYELSLSLLLGSVLGGIVSISADPLNPSPHIALLIGAGGGTIVCAGHYALKRMAINDVTNTLPIHLGCGIWGTWMVAFSNPHANLTSQFFGSIMIALIAIIASSLVWFILKYTVGFYAMPQKSSTKSTEWQEE